MRMSNEVKVQQQSVSVGNDGSLERVHVCFGLRAAGHEVELDAVGPQLPEVGLVFEALVCIHEAPAEVVELADALVDGPQPSVIGFVDLVVVLHLVTEGIEFINDNRAIELTSIVVVVAEEEVFPSGTFEVV